MSFIKMTHFMSGEWGKGKISALFQGHDLSQGHTASKPNLGSNTQLVSCWAHGCVDHTGEWGTGLMGKLGRGLCFQIFSVWCGFQKVKSFLLLRVKNVLHRPWQYSWGMGVSRNGHFLLLEANRNPIPSQTELGGGNLLPQMENTFQIKDLLGLSEKR